MLLGFFERIKLLAIFSKHDGFSEEREWRYVYLKDGDEGNVLESMLYVVSGSSVQPEHKLNLVVLDNNHF